VAATILSEEEIRVLGALVEKQVTTPEYYPLTLNALVQACNQKSNRNPIVAYDEELVSWAIERLREKNLVYVFYGSTSRVPKYKHMMADIFGLNARELALVCVLMLRGAQTPGELRGRTDRLYDFNTLEEVEEALGSLSSKEPQALVARLPRQPGQKEVRYAHLLAGELRLDEPAEREGAEGEAPARPVKGDRLGELEREVETLREEVNRLRQEFAEFKRQFD
jgi:uncharacterized protein